VVARLAGSVTFSAPILSKQENKGARKETLLLKKLVIVGVVMAALVAWFAFDLDQALTLDAIKSRQAQLADLYQSRPLLVMGAYFAIYVLVTALSLPGAAIMTLLGGAMFGLLAGTLVVSFASSVGATLAMLVSRTLFRDWVAERFRQTYEKVNAGVDRDGALYLFGLRLVPAFPFFVINLVMGLTRMPATRFYWVSQLGMLPGTLVYVNAGTQLGQLDGLSGILSLDLIGAFVLLALFPWIARLLMDRIKARRVYQGWDKPKTFDRNLIVIGAGAAGLVTSYIGAAVKAKVTLVERERMGGDCLNTGCVPSKALIRSAHIAHYADNAEHYGLKVASYGADFPRVMKRVQQVISDIEPHDSVERYTGLGVDVRQGNAKLVSPWCVEIDGKPLTARHIVIASGGRPRVPNIPGLAQSGYLTSDTLWQLQEQPERMVIMGGGPIGCELAQAFSRLGTDVTLVEFVDRLLPRDDDDVSDAVMRRFQGEGVRVMTGHRVVRVDRQQDIQVTCVDPDDNEVTVSADALLVAVGREARTDGLGLETVGVTLRGDGTVETNEYLQTRVPNILACGDVTGPYQFTHVAGHQAWYAAVNALFGFARRFAVDYSAIPFAVFTDPEVARVGLNEREAQEQGLDYEVTRYGIDDLDRAIAEGEAHGFVKVLTVPGKDRILGVTIVGHHASELIAEYVLAMKHKLGLNKILGTVHAYPTLMEANKFVAGEWKRAHAPQGVLGWLQKFHAWRLR
jgi:dihydrolipoamide dehydrogenase